MQIDIENSSDRLFQIILFQLYIRIQEINKRMVQMKT